MLVVFKHGQRYVFLCRTQESNPKIFVRQSCVSDFEPVVLTISQCVDAAQIDGNSVWMFGHDLGGKEHKIKYHYVSGW